jgi:hypothetical protein
VNEPKTVFDFLRRRGSAFVSLVSNELMSNPAFLKAMRTAYKGGERLNGAVEQALKTMNVPSRTEFKRMIARVEALERELAEVRSAPAAPPAAQKAARKRPAKPPSPRRGKAPASRA